MDLSEWLETSSSSSFSQYFITFIFPFRLDGVSRSLYLPLFHFAVAQLYTECKFIFVILPPLLPAHQQNIVLAVAIQRRQRWRWRQRRRRPYIELSPSMRCCPFRIFIYYYFYYIDSRARALAYAITFGRCCVMWMSSPSFVFSHFCANFIITIIQPK